MSISIGITRKLHEAILAILKKRFNNLTADEASRITFDIVEAVEKIVFGRGENLP